MGSPPTTGNATITKGEKEVGTIGAAKDGFFTGGATASYKTADGTEVYTGVKYTTLYFFMTILDAAGGLVGKVAQKGIDVKKQEIEVGAGVDLLAVVMMSGVMGATSGAGGAAGALAGSGAACRRE